METIGWQRENTEELRNTTLVFLIKKTEDQVNEICLAMKKRGFWKDRWNGYGGKVEKGEEIYTAVKREAKEEIGVELRQSHKAGELSFYFPHSPDWNQKVHVYLSELWDGDPMESEEMKPQWFFSKDIPFDSMWPADKFWIPEILDGKLVKSIFVLGEKDIVLNKDIQIVKTFS